MARQPAGAAPPRAAVLTAAALLLCAAAVTAWAPAGVMGDASNLLQLAATAAGTASAARRGRHSTGRTRWAWLALSAACACWGAGQLHWTWQELAGHGIPFPSVSDVGFLAFPVLAAAALLLHPAEGGRIQRRQRVLDALMTATAVGLVSWETALGAVVAADSEEDTLASALLVAYPVLDVLLLVLTVLILARTRTSRLPLVMVGAGLASLSISDSLFAYLQTTQSYAGGWVDLGWVAGFLLIALAGTAGGSPATAGPPTVAQRAPSASTAFLPYLPVVVAMVTTLALVVSGRQLSEGELLVSALLVGLLLARQYLTLLDNAGLTADVAAREAMLRHQAFHDGLTGLANRALFRDRLDHALALHARDMRPVSVVFLDLDDFKVVNDTLGHAVGDDLLVRVADRLVGAVRSGDTVARLGGDEFAVLIEDGGDPLEIGAKALDALRTPVVLGGHSLDVHASVGVCTLAPEDAPVPADELLTRSDTAMYSAKRSGKSRIVRYSTGMSLVELEDQELRGALRKAVQAREVTLVYQPIVEVGTGRLVGLEALARWTHAGQPVGPDVFIPLAERTGLIGRLTDDLLSEACTQLAGWSAGRDAPLSVHVNVAPTELVSTGFVTSVADLVREHALAPGQLVVEITESGIFADLELARQTVAALRALGVGVSLDDFGVGYSSLAQLNSMPLDSVKIDRSFLAHSDTDARQATFLEAVLRLARDIDLPVVAEGVERPAQLEQLRRLGCPLAQGWLLGGPVPAAGVPALLAQGGDRGQGGVQGGDRGQGGGQGGDRGQGGELRAFSR
ncbi:EAL domain-containing protein [Modestobacter sp. I12A-02628]|uniref:Bifunctional diguanylate cyclase/phosphodiesterase n=1 Tax=Goekera deserti TaxID=2497753 RepID=A0A7K3WFF2_9ACTN|nr:bifunctional diguanylate cyclase/phosphodiesterase [Goekera deserti]MPQ97854.1 EAL domain-containing protein [Goekera deserti]NDI48499.1 EAL domain-containing protein [Goekera deserti]NEL55122.1 bifunctional diguanylate cyclase/phosphodiesterase [Goekera deserti]